MNAQDQALIADVIGRGAAQLKWNAYYSRVRFQTTFASSKNTIALGTTVTAFAYGIGQDMAAGGQSGNSATPADTNIVNANQTVSGENLLIHGVGLMALAGSDGHLLKSADGQISCVLSMNGGNPTYKLGIPSMLPGPGGIFGRGEAPSVAPSPFEVVFGNLGGITNGVPGADNYFRFQQPIIWRAAGNPDSSLNIALRAEYTINTNANFALATRTALAGVTSTFSGINAYTPPTAAATFLDFLVVLNATTFTPVSSN